MTLFFKKTDRGVYLANLPQKKGKLVQKSFHRLSEMGSALLDRLSLNCLSIFGMNMILGKNKTGFYILTDI